MHMDYLLQDFRLAFRRLRKSPGFAAAAIIALILRPLPVERPQELVFLNSRNGSSQSYPSYKDFRDRTRTLSGLAGYRIAPVAWTQNGNNAHAWGYEATGNYFQMLGVQAI